MTNNPTIDGVSRELIELAVEYLKIHGERSSIEYSTAEDLQALLDAKQRIILIGEPVGVLLIDEYFDNREVGDVDVQLDSGTCERLAKDFPGQSLALYIETPEVAALQSTIARLEARVAELESGRGEPVCYQARHSAEEPWFFTEKPGYWEWRPLFTAPPAPVAVVLPERNKATKNLDLEQCGYVAGWNACLDATAALNGVKP